MANMEVAVVEFIEGKRKVRYFTETKWIKHFDLDSPKAIDPEKMYDVKWQQSFHGDDEQSSHTGYYPGKILLVGANVDEIRLKAADAKIKNIKNLPSASSKPTFVKGSAEKRRARINKYEVAVKKQRMEKTLEAATKLQQSSRSPVESTTKILPPSPVKSTTKLLPPSPVKSTTKLLPPSPVKSTTKLLPPSPVKPTSSKVSTSPLRGKLSSYASLGGSSSFHLPSVTTFSPKKNEDKCSDDDDLNSTVSLSDKEDTSSEVSTAVKEKKCAVQDSDDEYSNSSGDNDATILLDNLKKEHRLCKLKIIDLEEKLSHFKKEAHSLRFAANQYKEQLNSSKKANEKLQEQLDTIRELNFKLQQEMFLRSSGKGNDGSCSPKERPNSKKESSSEKRIREASPASRSPNTSPKKEVNVEIEDGSDFEDSVTPARRTLFEENHKTSGHLSQSESDEDVIIERVSKDLQNKKRLPIKNDKVYLGSGVAINEKAWNDKIRKQSQDTIMVKDLTHAIYGKEAMARRTVDRAVPGKQKATPKKIRLITAALKGKLDARGASKEEKAFIVKKAPQWIGEKFYDSSRVRTSSSKKNVPQQKEEAKNQSRD